MRAYIERPIRCKARRRVTIVTELRATLSIGRPQRSLDPLAAINAYLYTPLQSEVCQSPSLQTLHYVQFNIHINICHILDGKVTQYNRSSTCEWVNRTSCRCSHITRSYPNWSRLADNQSEHVFIPTTTERHRSLGLRFTGDAVDFVAVVNTARVEIEFPLSNSRLSTLVSQPPTQPG